MSVRFADSDVDPDALDDLIDRLARLAKRLWMPVDDVRSDAEFREEDHPRASDGKFGSGGAGGSNAGLSGTRRGDNGKLTMADGSPLPAHVERLKLPPAWTDVRVSTDPKSPLQAQGRDAKGRIQSVYSLEHSAKQAEEKFARVHLLAQEFDAMSAQNADRAKSADPRVRDSAECLALVMKTGIRPGSDDDTGADKKAYGATTLIGSHVIVDGDSVRLRFVGKKGVDLDIPVDDGDLAAMLKARAKASGPDGRLFPNTSDRALLEASHGLDHGKFKTKDFRTHIGTRTAAQAVKAMPSPKSEKEYVRAVKEVATRVARVLGNTPTVALQSYISPTVFSEWGVRG